MKISIITVCYNSEKTIRDTVESVLSQTYPDYEYLIIDGKSSDSTLEIINEYKDERIKLVSEKDKGLDDAMNKGIRMSTGDIVGIINSDDVLYDENIFQAIVDNYKDDTEILYGNIKYYNEDFSKVIRDYISGIGKDPSWCPAHPSMYVRREVFDRIGMYDLQYRINADYDFMVRCNINKVKYQYLNIYFVKMRYGGVSNGFEGYRKNFIECYKVLKNNNVSFPLLRTLKRSIHTIIQIIKH